MNVPPLSQDAEGREPPDGIFLDLNECFTIILRRDNSESVDQLLLVLRHCFCFCSSCKVISGDVPFT